MKQTWSFHRSALRKKRIVWFLICGILLFILGFFAARPICLLFGLV